MVDVATHAGLAIHEAKSQSSIKIATKVAAQVYLKRGWQPVRLHQGAKVAFERDWPRLLRTADDFKSTDNIGLRFGPESGGLVDIDLDLPQARQLIGRPVFGLSHLPEFGRQSLPAGMRGHRIVRCSDAPNEHRVFGFRGKDVALAMKALGLRQTVIEIRASNTTQTAVPPSTIVDANGAADKLVWSSGGPPLHELPDVEWPVLVRQVGLLAFASFAAAAGTGRLRAPLVRHLYGALREADLPVAAAVTVAWEVERLLGGTGDSDPEEERRDEGIVSFVEFVELPQIEPVIRGWLGLKTKVPHQIAATASESARGISADDLEKLLDVLDPCNFASYDAWRDLMFASHSATSGSEAGREVFVDWSARNPDYSELDWQEKVRSAWRRAKASRASKIGVGTLLKQVIDAGHRDLVRQVMRQYDQFEDQEPIDDAPIRELDRSDLDAAPILDELPGTEGI